MLPIIKISEVYRPKVGQIVRYNCPFYKVENEEKEIPKKVLNIGYNSRDFCNYGKCPTCNNTVEGQSISGHTEEENNG